MSFLLNAVKEKVSASIAVEVGSPSVYGTQTVYPVIVKDTSQSVTAGWTLMYNTSKSSYKNELYASKGKFSSIMIPGFSKLGQYLLNAYSRFLSNDKVVEGYAEYDDMDPNLKFTAVKRQAGVSITMTVTDDNSPFHMLAGVFFVMPSKQNPGQTYIVGQNNFFDTATDVWTDNNNFNMIPDKQAVIELNRDTPNGPLLMKAGSTGMLNDKVIINEDKNVSKIKYIHQMSKPHRMLAGIFESAIMEVAFAYAINNLPQVQAQNTAFNGMQQNLNPQQNQQWFGNTAASQMAQGQQFGNQQQQNQQFGGQTQQNQAFGGQTHQSQQFGNQQSQAQQFGNQQQNQSQQFATVGAGGPSTQQNAHFTGNTQDTNGIF